MKRFLPVLLALSFSAIAVAAMFLVFRLRTPAFRAATESIREKVDEVIEEITEREEDER